MRAASLLPLILKSAPHIIESASGLLGATRRRPDDIAAAKDVLTLRDQVAALAKDQQVSAEVMKQLADQVSNLSKVAEATASKGQLTLIVAAVACALGLAALLVGLLK